MEIAYIKVIAAGLVALASVAGYTWLILNDKEGRSNDAGPGILLIIAGIALIAIGTA